MKNTIIIQTCPECGADLEHMVFATYPPIPAWRGPAVEGRCDPCQMSM